MPHNDVSANLLRKINLLEKEQKCLNIKIKGLPCTASNTQDMVAALLGTVFGLHEVIQWTRYIPLKGKMPNIVIVQLKTDEARSLILKNKRKMADSEATKNIFIDKDLTTSESKVANEIMALARSARNDGKKVSFSYNWINIDNTSYQWDDQTQKLVQRPSTRTQSRDKDQPTESSSLPVRGKPSPANRSYAAATSKK